MDGITVGLDCRCSCTDETRTLHYLCNPTHVQCMTCKERRPVSNSELERVEAFARYVLRDLADEKGMRGLSHASLTASGRSR